MVRSSKSLVVCLDNAGYELALERRKIYVTFADARAKRMRHIRVVDESGEDYLFPMSCFAATRFPESVRRALMQAA